MADEIPDIGELPFDQVISVAVMIASLLEMHPGEDPYWHFCKNGCCVLLHEPGHDETVWVIGRTGLIEKVDRYGNVVEVIEV